MLRGSVDRPGDGSADRRVRLVDAARSLANETASASFTVAQVAARAGVSLKAFYGCFASKDDLLVALLAEDSRLGAVLVGRHMGRHDTPPARLEAYVDALFSMLAHPGAIGYAGVLVREHRRLAEDRPDEMRAALAPLVDLLADELAAADAQGAARIDDPARVAATLFGMLLAGINDVTVGRADPAELAPWLWGLCWWGLKGTAMTDAGSPAVERR